MPGLAAMAATAPLGAGFLVRPLLGISRQQLRGAAPLADSLAIEDPSNADDGLDRNYLRHQVLPAVMVRWPGAARTVARSARHVAAAQGLLDELARTDVARAADGAALSVAALRALPLERRRNALRYWLREAGCAAPDAARLEEIAVTCWRREPARTPWCASGPTASSATPDSWRWAAQRRPRRV